MQKHKRIKDRSDGNRPRSESSRYGSVNMKLEE